MFRAIASLTTFAATVAAAVLYTEGIRENVDSIKADVATVKTDIDGIKTDVAIVSDIKSDTEDIRRVQSSVQQALSSFGQPNSFGTRYKWEGDAVPVRMIARNDGLCYIVAFKGPFEGAQESVSIYVEDGVWFLKGNPEGNNIVAEAQCWRFPVIQQ